MLLVVGDVTVDSEAPVVTSSISRICRLSLSEVLIEVWLRTYIIYRDEFACVFVNVPVDSGVSVVTSSISRICRLGLSEVLIGVGLRTCIHSDECACVFLSVCVCTVFLKKKILTPS